MRARWVCGAVLMAAWSRDVGAVNQPPVQIAADASLARLDADNGFRDAKFGTPLAKFKGLEKLWEDRGFKAYVRKSDKLEFGKLRLEAVQYWFDDADTLQLIRLVPGSDDGSRNALRGECRGMYGFSEWATHGMFRSIGKKVCLVYHMSGPLAGAALSPVNFWERWMERETVGNMNSIRSAISICYGDNEGWYPPTLSTKSDSVMCIYLESVPPVKATHMGIGKGLAESPEGTQVLVTDDEQITTPGRGWRYNPRTGRVFVNSSATDSRGVPYSTYGY